MSDFALNRANTSNSVWSKLSSNLVGWIGKRSVGRIKHGCLKIILPSGKTINLGNPTNEGPHAQLKLNNFNVIRESARRGTVGFAAAFMNADIEVDDLVKVFTFFLLNRDQLVGKSPICSDVPRMTWRIICHARTPKKAQRRTSLSTMTWVMTSILCG